MAQEQSNRRGFLKTSAGALAATSVLTGTSKAKVSDSSNSNLRIGFIGPGGRGFGAHVKRMAKLQVEGEKIELVAVCDVYNKHAERAAKYIKKETGFEPKQYEDYIEMLEKEDLDGVCIGTPDHWHAKQTIECLGRGIHVYCEKPMTKTVEEAIDVLKAWQKSGKVMQVGVQSTSLPL